VTDEPPEGGRRRVRRGEGEVTEWPRGLVDYVPKGAPEGTPSSEEDRDQNRLRLASRLLGVARNQGRFVDAWVTRLRQAERAFRMGEREKGRRIVEEVLAEVEATAGVGAGSEKPTA
jgi:hypothetical protein